MELFGTSKLDESYQPHIVQELTDVIREWVAVWKQLYVSHHSNFYDLEIRINNLITLRNEISQRELLINQLKERNKLASLAIDTGNKFLKLDMMVRDEQCKIINPVQTPIFLQYENYVTTTARIKNKKTSREYKKSKSQTQYEFNQNVYLHVKNRDRTSLLQNLYFVKNMAFLKVISPNDVKNYFQTILLNEELSKGIDLLNFLNWTCRPVKVFESLKVLKQLNGKQMLIFLHDVLDALFNIYQNNSIPNIFDTMVFDCLIYIIKQASDENYQQFKQVLDVYIEKHFYVEMAYKKLMTVLKNYLQDWDKTDVNYLLNVYKSFKYIMKFTVKSKSLSSKLENGNDQQIFEKSIDEIFSLILNIMRSDSDSAKKLHSACLQYVPQSIPDIMTVFSSVRLSSFLVELLDCLPLTKLLNLKLTTMSVIVHSQLFLDANCRAILLRYMIVKIVSLMENPKLETYAKLIGDIFDFLYMIDADFKFNDIYEIITVGLCKVTHIIKVIHREDIMAGYVVSLMISIIHQMTDKHFDAYIKHFILKIDLLDFLKKILLVFRNIIYHPIFPNDWFNMIMLLNSAILKALKHIARAIREYFFDDFDDEMWTIFFDCAFAFLLQPSLQLEQFSYNKRSRVVNLFGDMRIESINLIETMWLYLKQHKMRLMPDMIGFFLETSLIPVNELRQATIPIFFDMMQCELNSNALINGHNKDSSNINSNFDVFQNKMIENIDRLIVDGKGDEEFKELFKTIFLMHCENNSAKRNQGIEFVEKFTDLLERLLEYQMGINDENIDNKINCTINVLNFYEDIQQHKLIISYVNNLYSLHLKCGNYTEAAYTLMVHSELLSWSNDALPSVLKSPERYPTCKTYFQLKEALYLDIIDNFNKGKMWECAVSMCKELVRQCESETYDYIHLSSLFQRVSNFYGNIMKQLRLEPEYFRVAYYGKGFPSFLQNKVFIYRGKEYERLSDFLNRTLNQFPNATVMQNLSKPGPKIIESSGQYIQINKVEPIMDERNEYLLRKPINEQILRHYRVNDIKKFKFSITSNRIDPEVNSNDYKKFANLRIEHTVLDTTYSLPCISLWTPVKHSEIYEISQLKNAIKTMQETNKDLRELIVAHINDSTLPLNSLNMKLNYLLDDASLGGAYFLMVHNYEKLFFTSEYLANHQEEKQLINILKDLVASQIPLLDIGIKVHSVRASPSLAPLQLRFENCFDKMKKPIEKTFGKKTCDINFDVVKMQRHKTVGRRLNEKRCSGSSIGSAEGQNGTTKPSFMKTTLLSSNLSIFSGPVLVSSSNKFGTIGALTRKDKKKKKKCHRTVSKIPTTIHGNSRISNNSVSNNQRYTMSDQDNISSSPINSKINTFSSPTAIKELRQEVTSKIPQRSEVKKNLSLPKSSKFQYSKLSSMNSLHKGSLYVWYPESKILF